MEASPSFTSNQITAPLQSLNSGRRISMNMPLLTRSPASDRSRSRRPPFEIASRSRGASRGSLGSPPMPRESVAPVSGEIRRRLHEDTATRREQMRDDSAIANRTVAASNPPISTNRSSSTRDTTSRGCCFIKLINAGARCRHPRLTGAESLSGPVSSPRRSAISSRPSCAQKFFFRASGIIRLGLES